MERLSWSIDLHMGATMPSWRSLVSNLTIQLEIKDKKVKIDEKYFKLVTLREK